MGALKPRGLRLAAAAGSRQGVVDDDRRKKTEESEAPDEPSRLEDQTRHLRCLIQCSKEGSWSFGSREGAAVVPSRVGSASRVRGLSEEGTFDGSSLPVTSPLVHSTLAFITRASFLSDLKRCTQIDDMLRPRFRLLLR